MFIIGAWVLGICLAVRIYFWMIGFTYGTIYKGDYNVNSAMFWSAIWPIAWLTVVSIESGREKAEDEPHYFSQHD